MRYAVLILAVLYGILSVVVMTGLVWRLLGWSVASAFHSSTPSAATELSIWSAALALSLSFTIGLTLLYCRKWKQR